MILAQYPEYGIRHIRDALRFKAVVVSVLDAFHFLDLLTNEFEVVKLDLVRENEVALTDSHLLVHLSAKINYS